MNHKNILPRFIAGNRGDISSRWGVINAFANEGIPLPPVYSKYPKELPKDYQYIFEPGPFRNLLWKGIGRSVIKEANTIIWTPGLDFQDDSSRVRLLFHYVLFKRFKIHGLKIISLFQGAGPITTSYGKRLTRKVMELVDLMVARDPESAKLITDISPNANVIVGHDGIFLPGFVRIVEENQYELTELNTEKLLIGFNIRLWFHFQKSILPYNLNKKGYQKRAAPKMEELVDSSVIYIKQLREKFDARVILISEYIKGVQAWEDDTLWLRKIKDQLIDDEDVILADPSMDMYRFFYLMSELDFMVGMRLHAVLIALRFGVPSLSVSYTNKCRDIMGHLGLKNNVVDVESFIETPELLMEKTEQILSRLEINREITKERVSLAINENTKIFKTLFSKIR